MVRVDIQYPLLVVRGDEIGGSFDDSLKGLYHDFGTQKIEKQNLNFLTTRIGSLFNPQICVM
jgi:hypothetical protein